jgi:hypothetical protein
MTRVCGEQLSEVAQEMDRREQEAFAGTLSGESNNVRLDGFFSVQVLSCARRGGSAARCVFMRAFSLACRSARYAFSLACGSTGGAAG